MEITAILIALILLIIMVMADIQADIIKRIHITGEGIKEERAMQVIQTVGQVLTVIILQKEIRTIGTIADMEAAIMETRVIMAGDILIQATIQQIIIKEVAGVSGAGLKIKLFHHQIDLIPILKADHINPIHPTKDNLIRARNHTGLINLTPQVVIIPGRGQKHFQIQARIQVIPVFHTPLPPLTHLLPIQPSKREISTLSPKIDS